MSGKTISHYQVLEKLGQGGMGEVYRADDTNLSRQVAIKVLPDEFAHDAERLTRFEREAKLLASLNHPNIASIYGLEKADGKPFLVLELVEGQTLAERLKKGRIPLDETLDICRQIAEGLEAAHEKGIIHRDLKPANVKVTPEGKVKVLDFGLAKAFQGETSAPDVSKSPTLTEAMTHAGVILGTAAYMSPEQAKGKPVDKRIDIWAFGCILYECLTGKRVFEGANITETLASTLKEEPDWGALPAETPEPARQLLYRCLAKDPSQRLRDIADARFDIEASLASPAGLEGSTATAPTSAAAKGFWPRRRALALASVTLLVVIAASAAMVWHLRPGQPNTRTGIVRLDMPLDPAEEINAGGAGTTFGVANPGGSRTALVWMPDGRALVFVGRRGGVQQLYIRALNQNEARLLPGTEGAQVPTVSEDGQSVAFWAEGMIRKVTLSSGLGEPLLRNVRFPPFGMAWSAAGLLIGTWDAVGSGGISLFTQRGLKPVTIPQQGELGHVLPQWLPGNTAFLYTAKKRAWTWSDDSVFACMTATGERKLLLPNAVDARYVPGYLVFLREKKLYAVAFDVSRLETRGQPVLILDNVAQALANVSAADSTGAGHFSIAGTGSLAYLEDRQKPWPDNMRLVRVDRSGKVTPLATPAQSYATAVRVEPGTQGRIANVVNELGERSVWVFDLLNHGRFIAKLGVGGEVGSNRVWSLDGKRLAFNWRNPRGVSEIVWQVADGSDQPEKLADEGIPGVWTPGGELLGLKDQDDDIWVLADRGGKAVRRPILQTPGVLEQWPTVSHDGRWLAYGSNELGRFDIYVQPYPGISRRQTVSVDGGECPLWNPSSEELFFLTLPDKAGERHMMAVAMAADGGRPGTPQPLFPFKDTDLRFWSEPTVGYDAAPDGRSFYTTQVIPTPPRPPVTHIHLILNFVEDVKAKVPRGK
ncbi:MAG: serine/threonine protein kinase [Acidobacteria bacterium]|nr:serine/threonine protein kinase [Acidobacteriota bacterium]